MTSAFEKLQDVSVRMANVAAQTIAYKSWSDECSRAHIREAFSDIEKSINIDFNELTTEELEALGCRRWDEESNLLLLPLWLFLLVPDDMVLTNFNGEKKAKAKCDNDIRFGCVAYGFEREDLWSQKMTVRPTVAEFFAQYAEKGHIFPDGGLVVSLRNGDEAKVFLVMPQYCQDAFPTMGAGYQWTIRGGFSVNDTPNGDDIVAVLDEAGNVIAGELYE